MFSHSLCVHNFSVHTCTLNYKQELTQTNVYNLRLKMKTNYFTADRMEQGYDNGSKRKIDSPESHQPKTPRLQTASTSETEINESSQGILNKSNPDKQEATKNVIPGNPGICIYLHIL